MSFHRPNSSAFPWTMHLRDELTAAFMQQPTRRALPRAPGRGGGGVTRARREWKFPLGGRGAGAGFPEPLARRRWRLLQGLSGPAAARSVQRRREARRSAPRTLRAPGPGLRAGVPASGGAGGGRPGRRHVRAGPGGGSRRRRAGGCPRRPGSAVAGGRRPSPVPREMNGPRAPPQPGSESGGPRRKPLRAAEAAPGGAPPGARGAASRFFGPIRPRPAPPAPRGRPHRRPLRSPQLLAVRPRNAPVVGL